MAELGQVAGLSPLPESSGMSGSTHFHARFRRISSSELDYRLISEGQAPRNSQRVLSHNCRKTQIPACPTRSLSPKHQYPLTSPAAQKPIATLTFQRARGKCGGRFWFQSCIASRNFW